MTATNAFGQITATSDPDGPVLPAAPVVSTQPVITGIAQQGVTLSVSNGVWSADPNSNDPNGYTYAWEDCDSSGTACSSISGATSSSYTLQASDVGSTIVAVVTASNLGGASPATSDLVGPVLPAAPVVSTPPVISGAAQQGDDVEREHRRCGAPIRQQRSEQLHVAWQDCDSTGTVCSSIGGATSSSYTVQASDVGSTIVAVVTATNLGGASPATSDLDGPVLPAAPVVSTQPVITGIAQQGVTLSVSNGVWSADPNSNDPNGYTYAWEDCDSTGSSCTTIAGATSSTYKVTAADIGSYVSVIVTASNSGGHDSGYDQRGRACGARGSGGVHAAGDQRGGAAGDHADREHRSLEQQSDRVQLRLAGLQ